MYETLKKNPRAQQLPVTLLPISPLKVPRRSTLCAPVRTPELPARAFDASLSMHATASAPPATRRYTEIARKTPASDASSETRPKIRPLPNIPLSPGPKSAPPLTPRRQTSTSSFRPLPRVPEAAVSVSVSVTPASPVDPPLPVIRSQTHLFPPPTTVVAPPRFASLSLRLDTSPDALEPRVSPPHAAASRTEPPSVEPSGPALPSPATARRRRMSKLRRHLGESVQILFTDAEEKREFGDVCSQTAVAVRKLLELDAADDDDDSDTDDESDRYSLVLAHGDAHCAIPLKRYSTKWIREQGSRQFVEENYSNILRDLRAL